MRKKISKLLVSIAKWLTPTVYVDVFENEQNYEMKVCGYAFHIDKHYIKQMMKVEHISSRREAMKIAKKRELEKAKRIVMEAVEKKVLETRTYLKDGYPVVEARVNCYVAKET